MSLLLFLVGLSGSGKTTVGRLLSARLQLPFLDTDAEIERRTGRKIADLFATEGEASFRAVERAVIAELCQRTSGVVATGGGAPVDADNRAQMARAGRMVWLDAPTSVLATRTQRAPGTRPLLAADAEAALDRLRAERAAAYAACGPRVDTEGRTPAEVAEEVLRVLNARRWLASDTADPQPPLWVHTSTHSYPIYTGAGLLAQLPALLERHGLYGRAHVLVDERVDDQHHRALAAAFAEMPHSWRRISGGEENKDLRQVDRLYDALLAERIERRDTLVAIGGGVVGDLVGFVAATVLRGVRFVQVPTTVLSQVDSSVGGKVGVDHPRGKNLIGAFYQPHLVVADLDLLASLPPRQIAAGWAEVVKIAVVQDEALFVQVEAAAEALSELAPAAAGPAIRRAIELKARLVELDERDQLGIRAVLNYGHTIGHALEAASDFSYLHGEAVAVGMTAAARLAHWFGLHPEEAVARQDALLRRLKLPLAATGVSRGRLTDALGFDKKRESGRLEWVLPTGLGAARSGFQVPPPLVDRAVDEVLGGN